VLIIGTCGAAGYAVIGADRVAGQPSRPSLPSPVIGMARCMLDRRHTVSKTYGPAATKQHWHLRLDGSPRAWLNSEHGPGAMTLHAHSKPVWGAECLLACELRRYAKVSP
jgi:hypothetical protein